MTPRPIHFLLGARVEPTDGVADYCENVATELRLLNRSVDVSLVPWRKDGWLSALQRPLRAHLAGSWCVVHFTNYSWSRHGVPLGASALIGRLRSQGALVATRFHDPAGHPGTSFKAAARRVLQERAMALTASVSNLTLHNVPPSAATWLPSAERARYVPVGSNVPVRATSTQYPDASGRLRIGVFGLNISPYAASEPQLICEALRLASGRLPRGVDLVVMGWGALKAEAELRGLLEGSDVRVTCHGVLELDRLAEELGSCHALLFTRGPICTQRTTVLGALANGVPVVGMAGKETTGPILEAGLSLAAQPTPAALADALVRLAASEDSWRSHRTRAVNAFAQHFTWAKIGALYSEYLP